MVTPKQLNVLRAVKKITLNLGVSPSYGELAAELGLSSLATVAAHVNHLIASGHLVCKVNRKRTIELTVLGMKAIRMATGDEMSQTYHGALQRIGNRLRLTAGTSLTEGAPERMVDRLRDALVEIQDGLTTDVTSKHIARKALGWE